MKVLIQHRHGDEISGVTTYVSTILPELRSLDIDADIVSTQKDRLIVWLRKIKQCDIVHMNSNHLGFAAICKLLGKKIVIKYHFPFYKTTHSEYFPSSYSKRIWEEIKALQPKSNYPLKWKLFAAINYVRLGIRMSTAHLADLHIACSEFMAKSLDFPWPVETVYNPISLHHINSKKLSDLEGPLTFTFVGRIEKDKGVDLLLNAAAHIAPSSPKFKIYIIGNGTFLEPLKELSKKLDLEDKVIFKGKLPPEELLPIVQKSLALVVPSRIQDPAPYVVMEASSVATCSITSEAGGLPEIATPVGLSFEREDFKTLTNLLQYALENPEEMLQRGQQAYEYTGKNFSPMRTACQLAELCSRLNQAKSEV
ncbi:MAG: glycosyltransferase family 4 protein [Cyanobacteria bacterium P01_C01_bin.120]